MVSGLLPLHKQGGYIVYMCLNCLQHPAAFIDTTQLTKFQVILGLLIHLPYFLHVPFPIHGLDHPLIPIPTV